MVNGAQRFLNFYDWQIRIVLKCKQFVCAELSCIIISDAIFIEYCLKIGQDVVIGVRTHSMGLIHYTMLFTSEDIIAYNYKSQTAT